MTAWRAARDRARTLTDDHPGRLALRHLVEQRVAAEFFRRSTPMALRGAEHLRPGQIIAGLHLGPMAVLQQTLAVQSGGFHLSRWPSAELDEHTRIKLARLRAAGVTVVERGGSYGVLRDALLAGESCWLAADAPGRRPARLLGREVCLATGIEALAADTGAEVLPAYALRVGLRPVGFLGPPVDPAGLTAWADATLRRHLGQAMPELALTVGWSAARAERPPPPGDRRHPPSAGAAR